MEIDKLFENNSIDSVADNVFGVVNNSVSEVREMQRKKVAENVQLVVNALKKIEQDIKDQYDSVSNNLEKRIISIKDGRDGIDGRDGKDGKDGKQGKDGRPGRDGKDGKNGLNGESGEDGVSVVNAHIDFDGSLIISLSSGKEINVGEVVAPALAEQIKVITNGGGTSQSVLDTLTSLQSQIDALSGATIYKGLWNASTNSPALTSSVGTSGNFYIVSVAGSTSLDGITNWGVGDWAIFNGSVWQRVEGGAAGNFTTVTASSLTSGRVTYAGTAGLLQDSSNLTFNGTTLTSAGFSGPLNGTVGATTPAAGAFTTLSANSGATTNIATFTGPANGYVDVTDGTGVLRMQMLSNVPHIGSFTNHNVNFITNNTVRATLSSAGLAVTGTLSATGAVTFPAGTVALPSITTSGDTNTGIYFPAADTVGITAGGGERARIEVTGISSAYSIISTAVASTVGVINTTYGGSYSTAVMGYPETHVRPNPGYSGSISFTENTVADRWSIGIKPADSNLYFFNVRNITSATAVLSINSRGYLGIASTPQTYAAIEYAETTAVSGGSLYGIEITPSLSAGTTAIEGVRSRVRAATGTHVSVTAVRAGLDGFAVGSTITTGYGVRVTKPTGAATTLYGVASEIDAASGYWNIYASGTARNYFNGALSIGATTDPGTNNLLVNGGTITTGSTTALSLATSGGAGVVVSHVASAVNYIQIAPAATTGSPFILANGSDTNVSLSVSSKGSTYIDFFTDTFASQAVRITHTASANRCITLTGSNGGNPTIGTSAGSLAISTNTAVSGAGAFTGTTTIGNDQVQIGFSSPEGFIKSKNSSGSPASNLGFYTTDGAGTQNRVLALSFAKNMGFNGTSYGSGEGVIFLANASVVPSANPTGGGVLYVDGGALKYRGSSGTITTIANA